MHAFFTLTKKQYDEWRNSEILTYYEIPFSDGFSMGLNARKFADGHNLLPILYNENGNEINEGPVIHDLLPGQNFSVTEPKSGSRYTITLTING